MTRAGTPGPQTRRGFTANAGLNPGANPPEVPPELNPYPLPRTGEGGRVSDRVRAVSERVRGEATYCPYPLITGVGVISGTGVASGTGVPSGPSVPSPEVEIRSFFHGCSG